MEKGRCKHFNGAYHNKICDAGVCYRDVTPEPDRREGSALRLPCKSVPYPNSSPAQLDEFNKRGKCAKYQEPTQEEIDEYKRIIEDHMARFMLTRPLISKVKKEHKGQDWKGVETCPICSAKLHMTHSSYNGHVWGQCETEDCLSWME